MLKFKDSEVSSLIYAEHEVDTATYKGVEVFSKRSSGGSWTYTPDMDWGEFTASIGIDSSVFPRLNTRCQTCADGRSCDITYSGDYTTLPNGGIPDTEGEGVFFVTHISASGTQNGRERGMELAVNNGYQSRAQNVCWRSGGYVSPWSCSVDVTSLFVYTVHFQVHNDSDEDNRDGCVNDYSLTFTYVSLQDLPTYVANGGHV